MSDRLEAGLRVAVDQIPADRRGSLTATASRQGVELAAAQRFGRRGTLATWAGRTWTGGWDAGVRGSLVW